MTTEELDLRVRLYQLDADHSQSYIQQLILKTLSEDKLNQVKNIINIYAETFGHQAKLEVLARVIVKIDPKVTGWFRQVNWLFSLGANINLVVNIWCKRKHLPPDFIYRLSTYLDIAKDSLNLTTTTQLLIRVVRDYYTLEDGASLISMLIHLPWQIPTSWTGKYNLYKQTIMTDSATVMWALIAKGLDYTLVYDSAVKLAFELERTEAFNILLGLNAKINKVTYDYLLQAKDPTDVQILYQQMLINRGYKTDYSLNDIYGKVPTETELKNILMDKPELKPMIKNYMHKLSTLLKD